MKKKSKNSNQKTVQKKYLKKIRRQELQRDLNYFFAPQKN